MKIHLTCSGLGHQSRGFEAFISECFREFRDDPRFAVTLIKGGGESTGRERRVWNLPREGAAALLLGRVIGRWSYFVEQVTFFLGYLPVLVRERPDVVYYGDINFGNLCWRWRRLTRANYRLIFFNGANTPPGYIRAEIAQHLTPLAMGRATEHGLPAERQELLPHGVRIAPALATPTPDERRALRRRLRLPEGGQIVLSVGAIDKGVKRMDYVVEEVAALPPPRPFLLLLGQLRDDTPDIERAAREKLGPGGFDIRTVAKADVEDYYRAADVFAMASPMEGFGLVYVESLSHGLPCLAHDYAITRYIVADPDMLADFREPGALTRLLAAWLPRAGDEPGRRARHQSAYERFSWDRLRDRYAAMFDKCASLPRI